MVLGVVMNVIEKMALESFTTLNLKSIYMIIERERVFSS